MAETTFSQATGYTGTTTTQKPTGMAVLPGETFTESDGTVWIYTGNDWARQGGGDARSMLEGCLVALNRILTELMKHSQMQ